MRIHDVHTKIKEHFPRWQTQSEIYKGTVTRYVNEETVILDIGCGRTDYMVDLYRKAKKVIGQDPDALAISEHPFLHEKIAGDFDALEALPESSVDVIVSAWVLEHLPDPDLLFSHVKRLLKPGGVFISLTPNRFGLPSILSSIIPNKWHPKLVKLLWGRAEENTYPTFYKLNSRKSIQKFCKKYGLVLSEIKLLKDASYYIQALNHTKKIYSLHAKLLPAALSEGMLITISKTNG